MHIVPSFVVGKFELEVGFWVGNLADLVFVVDKVPASISVRCLHIENNEEVRAHPSFSRSGTKTGSLGRSFC
jgi:hypothetical protein